MRVRKTDMCENEACSKTAEYSLHKTYPDGTKKWIRVCRECEQEIGNENMRRAGGRYEG